jgi:ankyrin repeat protein
MKACALATLTLATASVHTARAQSAPYDDPQRVTSGAPSTQRGGDALGESGRLALVEAVKHKQLPTVRLLLDAGADPDAANDDREPVLIQAVHDKQGPIVELLLRAGADPNAENQNGEPALVLAVHDKEVHIVALLLGAGASANARNQNHEPTLVRAVRGKQHSIVAQLLAHGADPDARDQNQNPVLLEAARNRDLATATLLVEYGASILLAGENGRTAISIAARENDTAMLEMLLNPVVRAQPQQAERPTSDSQPHVRMLQPAMPTPQRADVRHGDALYSKRVAVVIGIDDYEHWPALEGAASDARRVSETLRAIGFDDVIEIYGAKATRRNLLTQLGEELALRTDESSLAMIYFAGHGQTETLPGGQKRGYIIPVDGDREQVFATAISMDQLRDLSNRLPARQVYYVMDSCYSGLGFVRGIVLAKRSDDYLQKMTGMRSVQMITAGLEGEMAVEAGGQGLFTTYFLRAVAGEADFNGDGYVTASEIGTYVRPQVSTASRQRQTPQFGALEGQGEVVLPVLLEAGSTGR